MLKDSLEDVELGEEKLEPRNIDRANLGTSVVVLGMHLQLTYYNWSKN